jgi:phosphoglucomutase
MVISPGDSLAIMLANAQLAPGYRQSLRGVARSMPTSRAVDMVAEQLGTDIYETPTGWRYFCNLLEAGRIDLCGEESFGTGSSHTREKDGLWAVLFWLNMMASLDQSVDEIARNHWQRFGRCFFQRRDYFIADTENAAGLIDELTSKVNEIANTFDTVESADIFNYRDPVDNSESNNQGIRIFLQNGGRIVYRLSGTGTAGATLRVYLDKPEKNPDRFDNTPSSALVELAHTATIIAAIEKHTGLSEATTIIG